MQIVRDWRDLPDALKGAAVAVGKLHGFSAAQFVELINCAATLGLATSRATLLEGATVRNPFTGHSGQSVAFGTEAPFLQQLNMDTVVLGPGSIDVAHQPDEYVRLDDIAASMKVMALATMRLMHLETGTA